MKIKRVQILPLMFLGLLITGTVYAQEEVKAKEYLYHANGEIATPFDNSVNKMAYNNWKFPVDAAITVGSSFNRYVSFLFEDSSVVWIPELSQGGPTNYPWHSVGAVFDPTDVNFELMEDWTRLDRWHGYEVDSIFLPYLYVRYTDSFDFGAGRVEIVDTLILQFFDYSDLEYGSFNGAGGAEIYAKPNDFDTNTLVNSSSRYEIKIPLTKADSTDVPDAAGWTTRGRIIDIPNIEIPSDPNLQGKRVCGFQITFKTMIPFQPGDTMETRDGSIPAKRLNYFGHYMYVNTGSAVTQTEYYNNSFWVPSALRHGDTLQGWTNSIPGNAYSSDRYVYYAFHISSATVGVDELNANMKVAVYPNPVSKSQILKLDFALINADHIAIGLYDLLGNKVKSVANGYYTSGPHEIDLDISDLPSGIYLYTIWAGNIKTTKKITISE